MTLLSGQGHLLDRDVEVQDRPAHRTRVLAGAMMLK